MVDQIVDAVRGMRDVLPNEWTRQHYIAQRIQQQLQLHGYQAIDLPILEHRDLYVRKLGEELAGKTYEFSFNGRDLVLRPEWTASVLRAYIAKMTDQTVPLRLQYQGPVFRYERPQRGTWRQFTQVGVEMIGAPSARADAEVLALACAGLAAVGIEDLDIRIGHIGIIRQLLGSLGVSERTRSVLTWSLERMRVRGVDAVRQALLNEIEGESQGFDTALLAGLDDAQAEALLLHTLRSIGVNLHYGTRPAEEIVNRLVRTMRRDDPPETIERAINVLAELSTIRATPSEALARLRDLVARYQLPDPGIADVEAVVALLQVHGLRDDRLELDFGLGRGLHYYTGMMFEISDATGLQLCGGGRYDELVTALGGRQPVPAVGFAYGLERVVLAVPAHIGPPTETGVAVVWEGDECYAYALAIAQQVRAHGIAVVCDTRERSLVHQLRDCDRRGLQPLIVTPADMHNQTVQWRARPANVALPLAEWITRYQELP
jgi:histidyl-tRNA synthetase